MSVVASDLVFYCSANMPTADTGTSGGGIDDNYRPVLSTGQHSGAATTIELASSNGAADGGGAKRVTIVGRTGAGTIVTENINVSSTNNQMTVSSNSYDRILTAEYNNGGTPADATGTITIQKSSGGTVITTIVPGERGFKICFYDSAAPTSGTTERYEKVYIKNNNSTSALTNATVALTASTGSVIDFGFSAVSSTQSVANRTSAPASVSFFGDTAAHSITSLSGEVATSGTLANSEFRGIWLKQTLTNASSAAEGTASFTVAGTTT